MTQMHTLHSIEQFLLPFATWSGVALAAAALWLAFAIPILVKRLTAGKLPPKTSTLVDLPLPILGPLLNLLVYLDDTKKRDHEAPWDSVIEKKRDLADIMRIPFFMTTTLAMVNTDGVRIGLTCKVDGKKVYEPVRALLMEMPVSLVLGLGDAAAGVVQRTAKLMVDIWDGTLAVPIDLPGSALNTAKKARRDLLPIIKDIIAERRASGCKDKSDMLSEMIKQGQLTDEEIQDQVLNVMLAGYETTAALMLFAMHILPSYPEVFAKLREEQAGIEGPLDYAKLESMTYMQKFIKEMLRHHSPALSFYRELTDTFQVGGFTVPRGYMFQYHIPAVQRNTVPDPDKIIPERFDDPACPLNQPYGLTPFGGGEYLCLGERFARMETCVFVRTLIQCYNWKHAIQNPRVWYNPVFFKFTDDLPLIFSKV
ncbi:cytochrome P450 [Tribonema minus]|uniref:Cytochrome P450 n=1 Tax=Tribonema minus TaxID=303371 RepID=A0A835YH38_9STRA|nr:cytochrome P450 [Tribonema minus]